MLCWIFISKGVANSLRSVGYETELWRVILYAGHFNDQILAASSCCSRSFSGAHPHEEAIQNGIGVVLVYSIISCAAVFISINTPLASFLGFTVPGLFDAGLPQVPLHERP